MVLKQELESGPLTIQYLFKENALSLLESFVHDGQSSSDLIMVEAVTTL